MSEAHHPIQLAARLTGLSTHVIRIWEERYQAVEPRRTAAHHRLYSENDIERLGLLRDVTHAGHNISQVARLSNDELRALAENARGLELQAQRAAAATPAAGALLDECLASVQSLDGRALHDTLKRAATTLGAQGVLHRLVAPLTRTLGDLWRERQDHARPRALRDRTSPRFPGQPREAFPACVVHAHRKLGLKMGEDVLVIGAGTMGLLNMLVAKIAGARVFVSDIDSVRLKKATALGAFAVFNQRELNLQFALVVTFRGFDREFHFLPF